MKITKFTIMSRLMQKYKKNLENTTKTIILKNVLSILNDYGICNTAIVIF